MKHGKDCPRWCSQCAGVTAIKRITIVDHVLCEDGRPTDRQVDDEPRQRMALMKKRRR